MRSGLLAAILVLLVVGCGDPGPGAHGAKSTRYGGVFNINESEPLRSIFPLTLTQASAYRIASQIYQGLTRFDPQDMSVRPALAESWDLDASSTIYTFHLRKGVHFHDDPVFPDGVGREMTADDVVNCFTTICTRGAGDQVFWLFQDRVAGANVHYASGSTTDPVKGIEKVDPYTVRITLLSPTPNFLRIMAHQGCWIWPKELRDTYPDLMQHAIGTGPFRLIMARPGEAMVMDRNPSYWDHDTDGAQLPYLDAVRITFAEDKNLEIDEFLKGHINAVLELPVERMSVLADSLDIDGKRRFVELSTPILSVQFYGFNSFKPPFDDILVRKAFAMAIDRHFLVDSVLKGVAVVAEHGIVAPGLPNYPYELVPGTTFKPDSARALLAEAGFPGGKGFPNITIQVNNDGFGYERVAGAVQEMIQRELGIATTVSVLPADQHYERIEHGQALMWREGWIADHPDPENFLALLYGKNAVMDTALPSSINNTRYRDARFDALFAQALTDKDEQGRMHLLAEAEASAMANMPLTPLYHERAIWLLRPDVHGLHQNSLEGLDLSAVWIEHGSPEAH